MKKFLLLWVAVCLIIIFLPKILDRLTSRVIYKEIPIWKIKEVTKEVPVYKDREVEKIVEKEKIVYKESQVNMLKIEQMDENNVRISIDGNVWSDSEVNVHMDNQFIYFKRIKHQRYFGATANTVVIQ